MTTRTTCDDCAKELTREHIVTLTIDWRSDEIDPRTEYHFCHWPCLMTWLKRHQRAYGWKDRT